MLVELPRSAATDPASPDHARTAAVLLIVATLAHGIAVAWLLSFPPRPDHWLGVPQPAAYSTQR